MTIQILQQWLWMETPLGPALCWAVIPDGAVETAVIFGVWQDDTKESWWWPNPQVRVMETVTGQRDANRSPIHLSEEEIGMLTPHIMRHPSSQFYWRVVPKPKYEAQVETPHDPRDR